MQKITPFLWFDDNAEEAVNFYTRIFPDAEITEIFRWPENMPGKAGTVLTIGFRLFGQDYTAMNGGPQFKFNESVSFVVHCDSQEEVDKYWDLLMDGGTAQACGWLKDRFGLSWQIVPDKIIRLMQDPDKEKATRAMQAMMQMVKLDLHGVEKAYQGA
ncbi:MAG TPA: VOC family protein [Chitinophagaceae bacterium]